MDPKPYQSPAQPLPSQAKGVFQQAFGVNNNPPNANLPTLSVQPLLQTLQALFTPRVAPGSENLPKMLGAQFENQRQGK